MKKIKQLLSKISEHPKLILAFYFLFLLIPSAMFSAKGFVRAFYPLMLLLILIHRWRAFTIITLPAFILVPPALYLQFTFNAPMNESFWLIVMGANIFEASDYLSGVAILPTATAIVLFIIWWFVFKINYVGPIIRNKGAATFAWALLLVPAHHAYKGRDDILKEFNHHFTESYPLNVFLSFKSARKEIQAFNKIEEFKNIDSLKIKSAPTENRTLVLVIGESARRDKMQLYGASTENNKYLKQIEHEILKFNNVITHHPHTVSSLPVMLTKQAGVNESFDYNYSFLEVFKAAGYKTFWISNQASLWSDTNFISKYVRNVDFHHFFHIHAANNPISYDGEVIELFEIKLLEPSDSSRLFVLHLQGSHYSFEKRYPSEFKFFDDSYDNSLLYTDYLLDRVIKSLRNLGESQTAMLYLSDHGLLLNACGQKYTHFDNKESFEIPFLLWTSSKWKNQNGAKLQNIKNNLNLPLSTLVLFDTLVDLAGISYTEYNPRLSVTEANTNVGQRLVKTYSQVVDYDQSQNDSACHLVPTN